MKPQLLGDFLAWVPPKVPSILGSGLMYKGTRVILYGKYKSLKTMLALNFTMCLAQGKPWLGFDTPPEGVRVLHLQLEIPHALLHSRMIQMCDNLDIKAEPWFWTEHFLKLDENDGYATIHNYVEEYQPDVLVVDPLYKVVAGDILNPHAIQRLLDNFDRLIDDFGISIFLVSHTRKAPSESWGTDDMIGAMFFSAWADSVIKVERSLEAANVINVNFDVVRHAKEEIGEKPVIMDPKTLDFKVVSMNMMEGFVDQSG